MGLLFVIVLFAGLGFPLFMIVYIICGSILAKKRTRELFAQGLMSQDIKNKSFSKSISGVMFAANDTNLEDIFKQLNKTLFAMYKIHPRANFTAGMIEFETKYLAGASLKYKEQKEGTTIFEFKVLGRGDYSGLNCWYEIACNIILTDLEKVIK